MFGNYANSRSRPHGLFNLNNSCHLNSLLQSLISLPAFAHEVSQEEQIEHNSHLQFLLHCMAQGQAVERTHIAAAVHELGAPFNGGNQEDAMECFERIFESMKAASSTAAIGTFTGSFWNKSECNECQTSTWVTEPFASLSLPLPRCDKVEFTELIQSFLQTDTRSQYKCRKCKKETNCKGQMSIGAPPRCLVVQLKRYHWDMGLRRPLKIESEVIIPDNFSLPFSENLEAHYSLCAVVHHKGDTPASGHYTSACLVQNTRDGPSWWLCDDIDVNPCFRIDAVNTSTSYMLFFQRVDASNEATVNETEMCQPKPVRTFQGSKTCNSRTKKCPVVANKFKPSLCVDKPSPEEAGVPMLAIDPLFQELKKVDRLLKHQMGSRLHLIATDMDDEMIAPSPNQITMKNLLTTLTQMREDTIDPPSEVNLPDIQLLKIGEQALKEMKRFVAEGKEQPTLGFFYQCVDNVLRQSDNIPMINFECPTVTSPHWNDPVELAMGEERQLTQEDHVMKAVNNARRRDQKESTSESGTPPEKKNKNRRNGRSSSPSGGKSLEKQGTRRKQKKPGPTGTSTTKSQMSQDANLVEAVQQGKGKDEQEATFKTSRAQSSKASKKKCSRETSPHRSRCHLKDRGTKNSNGNSNGQDDPSERHIWRRELRGILVEDLERIDDPMKTSDTTLANTSNHAWCNSKKSENKKLYIDRSLVSECIIGDTCWNCFRRKPDDFEISKFAKCFEFELKQCEADILKSTRKFANAETDIVQKAIKRGATPLVCDLCHSLLSMPASKVKPEHTWAAFVWKLLIGENTWKRGWALVPNNWRLWWVRSVSKLWSTTVDDLSEIECVFKDVTIDEEADVAALESLRWGKDILPREQSLMLADVKCPAGCAEWKHKANELPLDVVWEHLLDEEVSLYSPHSKRAMTDWFRDDYDVSECLLLNPKWKCMPSVCHSRKLNMPVVLCCRDHSQRTRGHMFHPCRHPLPVIATEKANQCASIVPVPRTLRKCQLSAYSASFQVAKMQGQYFGVDTMYLSTQAGWHDYQQQLAWDQDVLAYQGRADVRAHARNLCREEKVPCELLTNFEKQSDKLFPSWNKTMESCKRGGTHMTVDDAMRLHDNVRHFTEWGYVTSKKQRKRVCFRPNWPKHLVWVHNTASKHGGRIPMPPDFKNRNGDYDTRTAWTLSAMLVSVQSIWESVVSIEKDDKKPEGWLLAHLRKKCFPAIKVSGSANNPFKNKKRDIVIAKMIQPNISSGYSHAAIYNFFISDDDTTIKHPNMHITWDEFDEPVNDAVHTVVVIRKTRSAKFQHVEKRMKNNKWELRFLSMSEPPRKGKKNSSWEGRVFVRHGSPMHSAWWFLPTFYKKAKKLGTSFSPASIQARYIRNWNVAVYCKERRYLKKDILRQMMDVCGGQTVCVCGHCEKPLIVTKKQKAVLCSHRNSTNSSRCGRMARMKCPESNCQTALCKQHFNSALKTEGTVRVWHHQHGLLTGRKRKSEEIRLLDGPSNRKLKKIKMGLRSSRRRCFLDAQKEVAKLKETAFVCCLPQGDESHNIDVSMLCDPETCVPTTDAGTDPIKTEIKAGEYFECRMTNHALLNVYGTCLIRKNDKIQGTLSQQSFLQRHVSTFPGRSMPLIFPEGCLYTDVFPFGMDDGSIVGAMPFPLLNSSNVLKRCGMLPLHDTYKTRLKSPALLASSNPKYHFWAFDALANFSLRGEDTRLVLRRGFAERLGSGGVKIRGQNEPIFNTEYVESKSNVSKLAAAIAEKMPTYFYTHTLSMKTHFGMRQIWKWMTGDEVTNLHCKETSDTEIDHWRRALVDSFGSYLLRLWMEMIDLWILYITKSPEKPMGEITDHFCRIELQDPSVIGNLPHVHCLFWTNYNMKLKEDRGSACDNIRGFIDDVVRPHEEETLIADGIMKGRDEIIEFKETLMKILPHEHRRRCYIVVRNEDNGSFDLKLKCKVQNNYSNSNRNAEHTFEEVPVQHTKDAVEILKKLGLATTDDECKFVPLVDWLQSLKHYPPAQGNEGIISPVVGALVARNPNADNCQITSGHFISRHLNKYMVKVDQYGHIGIQAPEKGSMDNEFRVQGETLLNTKITSNAKALKDVIKKKSSGKKASALGINITDAYMHILEYPSVRTSLRFAKMCTDSYDTRAARERKRAPIATIAREESFNGPQALALTPINTLPAYHVRANRIATKHYPMWAQFRETQKLKMFDDLHSPLGLDSVTQFGFRPPELFWVRHQRCYTRWFTINAPKAGTRSNTRPPVVKLIEFCDNNMPKDLTKLHEMTWIAGDTKVIKMRPDAIDEILPYLHSSPLEFFLGDVHMEKLCSKGRTIALFRKLKSALTAQQTNEADQSIPLVDRFVDMKETTLPIVWINQEKPSQPQRFLIHLLLSFGSFIDEYDLFGTGSLRLSFQKARLLNEQDVEGSINKLTKEWIENQLRIMPVGTPTFDAYCVQGHNIISNFFRNGTIVVETPTVLYTHLREKTTEKNEKYLKTRQKTLVTHIHDYLTKQGITQMPPVGMFLNATRANPLKWDITKLQQPSNQPDESYSDQQCFLRQIKARIDANVQMTTDAPVNSCIVGGAGVGKTFCALVATLYARSVGAIINGTTLMSERAQELGVVHMNSDLAVPVADYKDITPGQLAEKIVAALHRKPEKLHLQRKTTFCLIDELGALPAELMAARDIALRYIRDNNLPNGGIQDLLTYDHLQLNPINGTHPMLSPFLTCTYSFNRLTHSVRASQNKNWQEIQAITRMGVNELEQPATKKRFVSLFTKNLSFVPDASHVPKDALFVCGKNEPTRLQIQEMQHQLRRDPNVVIHLSKDYVRDPDGNYRLAPEGSEAIKLLDRKVREKHEVFFFKNARYRITFNKTTPMGTHSNGQIAFLPWHPNEEDINMGRPVEMMVGPPGCTYLPGSDDTEDTLTGWVRMAIGMVPDRSVRSNSMRVQRTRQYGLELYVGSTCHSTMGRTLAKLATRIAEDDSKHSPYHLWHPSQVVVLLSRTNLPKQTYFITKNPKRAALSVYHVLCKRSPLRNYISNLLDRLCGVPSLDAPVVIDHSESVYRPRDIPIPNDDTGYVYILVSTKTLDHVYIGSCANLLKRFKQHNSGFGAKQTANPSLRPWALLAYITGFQCKEELYRNCEREWIIRKESFIARQKKAQVQVTIQDILSIADAVMIDCKKSTDNKSLQLKIMHCGTIGTMQSFYDKRLAAETDSFNEEHNNTDDENSSIETCESKSIPTVGSNSDDDDTGSDNEQSSDESNDDNSNDQDEDSEDDSNADSDDEEETCSDDENATVSASSRSNQTSSDDHSDCDGSSDEDDDDDSSQDEDTSFNESDACDSSTEACTEDNLDENNDDSGEDDSGEDDSVCNTGGSISTSGCDDDSSHNDISSEEESTSVCESDTNEESTSVCESDTNESSQNSNSDNTSEDDN